MLKVLLKIGGVLLILFVVLIGAAFWSDSDEAILTTYVRNEQKPTLKPGWKGNPVDQRGRFMNDEFPYLPRTASLLKWQTSANRFKAEKEADTYRPDVVDPSAFLAGDQDGILWLGHASFFVRLAGKGILIDPVFGTPPFVTRYTEVPSPLDKIQRVDYVLNTHDHRDHTDETTLRQIAAKFPNAKFIAGLNSEDILREWSKASNTIATTGWFQEFELNDPDIRVYFVPVRHWSRRGLFDTNQRLWGGFVIESGTTKIYHGGDSGYGRHYRETGEVFPNIDYFLVAVGAYEPRWFMEPVHTDPSDALKAFRDIGAKTLVPMHYGTFDLSDEPPGAPLRELLQQAERDSLRDKIRVLKIFEPIEIDRSAVK